MRINSHFDLGMEKVHFHRDKKAGRTGNSNVCNFRNALRFNFTSIYFSKHFFIHHQLMFVQRVCKTDQEMTYKIP